MDHCAILHNSRQSVYTMADILRLDSYNIVAHSWGGFVACLASPERFPMHKSTTPLLQSRHL